MKFKNWIESFFRYDQSIGENNPKHAELLRNIDFIRKDHRFSQYDDMQIEKMLFYLTPQEVIKYGPQDSLERTEAGQFYDKYSGELDFGDL